MTILRYKLSNDLMKNLQGRFRHVIADGQVMIIGGTARALAFKLIAGLEVKVNDCDYTVIGGQSFKKDHRVSPRGKNRVEVESDAPHTSIANYMSSRDLTVNQVAVDSKGNLYVTKNMVNDMRQQVINIVGSARSMTPREAVRACRFAMEYSWKLSPSIIKSIRQMGIDELKAEAVWDRYSQSFDLEGFVLSIL